MTVSGAWGRRRAAMDMALACGLGLGLLGSGCASRDATASLLTTAGAAAVIVGVSMAADTQCHPARQGSGPAYCSSGLSKGTRNAGTALAIAGVGAAAAGYALQPKGPDQQHPASAPRAPTRPYRLLRRPEVASAGASDPATAPEALPPSAAAAATTPPATALPATTLPATTPPAVMPE
jgi:hypothetical protein